ncbi:MAG: biopolymer transporter ExbD [bacterium]|nr:biopolymer transporter ExbD [bacterium]
MPFNKKNDSITTMSTINVVPLIDVALVLLVIFMIVTPVLHQSLNVQLPKTKSQGTEVTGKWVVTIADDKKIYLNDKSITLSELASKMNAIGQTTSSAEVFLRADRRVSYGYVVQVMDVIKKAGIHRLGIVTSPDITGTQ